MKGSGSCHVASPRADGAPVADGIDAGSRMRMVGNLQRVLGNRRVQALLAAGRGSPAVRQLQRQSRPPDQAASTTPTGDIHAAVAAAEKANDPMDVIRIMDRPDFAQATDDERIVLIRIANRHGGGDPGRLGRLWNSFPEARLPEVATKYMADWETTAKLWPGVPDLVSAVPRIVDAFRARLRSEAEANLTDNKEYVRRRMEQLGYGGAEATLSAEDQKKLRQEIQKTAYHLSEMRKTQQKARRIQIGRTVGKRVSTPVTFDPAGPDVMEMPKEVDVGKWHAIKKEWDEAQKPISEAAANHPELYELLARPDSEAALLNFSRVMPEDPKSTSGSSAGAAAGQGYQTQAKNLLTDLSNRIQTAQQELPKIDVLDLRTLHDRVYASPGRFKDGFDQWVARRAVERHQRDAHTMKVLAQMGEGAALLVATIATGGLALALTAVGTGVGVGHAAIDYAEAARLETLSRATPKKGTELVSQAEADAKMVEAGAEIFAAAIAVIATAGAAWAAAVEMRLASQLEKLVADKAIRTSLLAKVSDKRVLIKLLQKADTPAELKALLDVVDATKAGQLLELRATVRVRIATVRRTCGSSLAAEPALERQMAEAEELLKDAQKVEDAAKKVNEVVEKVLAPLRELVSDEALLQKLLTRAGDPQKLLRWLRVHKGGAAELDQALEAIWQKVPDPAQRARLMGVVERPGSLAKYLERVSSPTELEESIATTKASGVPGGVDASKWRNLATQLRAQASKWGGSIMVQGSRAIGAVGPESDLDIAILMDDATYDAALVKAYKTTPERIAELRQVPEAQYKERVPGKERGLWYSANKGKIARGELGLRGIGNTMQRELGLAKDVDISAILRGGDLDQGPYLPLP